MNDPAVTIIDVEEQRSKTKAEAMRRVGVIAEIEYLKQSGMTRTAAVSEISNRHNIHGSTLWNWLRLIEGVAASDRLPALAPRHMNAMKGQTA